MKVITTVVGSLQTNCYLLIDEETKCAALIDPGDEAEKLLALVEREGVTLQYILLTHGHRDHTLAVPALKKALPDVPVYIGEADAHSTGIGLLVIEAAILAQNNKTAAEISVAVESLKPYVRASFVVDTLTYLHRGGRCSAIAAMAGGLLKLHPQIIVEHGAMKPTKKYRGKMDSVILSYVKDMEPALKHARPDRVFITHSGCESTIINAVRSYLEGLGIFREILETRAGGVISSHCGPGTLGVLFIES